MRFDLDTYLGDKLGIKHRSQGDSGTELVCTCPVCGKPKLYANPKTGLWTCYRCDDGGGLPALIARVEGCDMRQARRVIERAASTTVGRSLTDLRAVRAERAAAAADRAAAGGLDDRHPDHRPRGGVSLPDGFVPVWDPVARSWSMPDYLRDRGIRARTAATYGLGVVHGPCPTRCKGVDRADRCDRCRYGGRLILPARKDGAVQTFQARSMDPDCPKDYRYLGPKGPRFAAVFGLDEAIGPEEVLLVEGAFDVMALAQRGYTAVGLMGKACSQAQAALLARSGFGRAVLMLDGDVWQTPKDRRSVIAAAVTLGAVLDTKIAVLPADMDPGDAPDDVIAAAVAAARHPTLRDRAGGVSRKAPSLKRLKRFAANG